MRPLRLSGDYEFSFTEYILDKNRIPRYAILSHTWQEGEEVTFDEFWNESSTSKAGYTKLQFCAQQAKRDGLEYFWVDTCCIDKSSSAELQEAINSMFCWYQNSERCYVYLTDVAYDTSDRDTEHWRRWKPAFKKSRWFTRGWTLQELIAPASVEFFSREGTYLGNKQSLEQSVHEITGIDYEALRGSPLSNFSKDKRLSWAAKRETTRAEDMVYCLLGIFDVYMPLIYGEGRNNALARLEEQIERIPKDKKPLLDDNQKRKLLDSLRFDQIEARQATIKNAHAKTCKWLLTKSEYIDWLNTTNLGEHGFLWIKGKPGTGKSTLMKFALAHARKLKDRTIVSFFFNARGEDLEKSTIGAYRSLLLQLLERLPHLFYIFDSAFLSSSSIKPDYEWPIESLRSLLEQAVQELGQSSVVCFIDALDECEEEQVRDMIQFFERILSVSPGTRFQVCFASRHYPHITIRNGRSLVLEGQEGHSQDITNYLQSELKIGNSEIAQQIRSELQEKASGVFMWVILVIGILNKEYHRGRIHALRRRLREIPDDLHTLFRDILTRDSHNMDELALFIQWVLFAKQPLSPEQLYFAVLSGVEPEAVTKWNPDEVTKDVIKLFILDSSKGLAEITASWNPTVQFIHESVRDFFLKEDSLGNIWPNLRSNLQGQSHEQLTQCCLAYMSKDVFAALRIPEKLPKASSQEAADLRKSANDWFPFLEYAVQNVLYHADFAEGGGIDQRNSLLSFPRPSWIKLANLFERRENYWYTEEMSLLYVLGERNMPALIRAHPSAVSCFEVGKERYGPPLFAALATGSKEALQAFVDALSKDRLPSIYLNKIQAHNYKVIGNQNLGRNFKFSNQRSVLSYLAELGNEIIVELLLETVQVDVDVRDRAGQTPLSWAAISGHEAVVKLLLNTGKVNVDTRDKAGQTPLSLAVEKGHEAVVKLLLDTGKVDADAKNGDGRTLLSWAVIRGQEAVVKLLLDTGKVDVDAKDIYHGRTPLSWAATSGHEGVVKLLRNTCKVDVDAKDSYYGRTPLSWAAISGHEAVVKLLLNTGKVNVDTRDKAGQTPLSLAAKKGHEAVVRLLRSVDRYS